MCHIKMFSSDQLSPSDKKYLDYRIPVIAGQRNDVLILPITFFHFLLGCDLLYAVIQIPVSDGLFKFQIFRCPLHFLFQLF